MDMKTLFPLVVVLYIVCCVLTVAFAAESVLHGPVNSMADEIVKKVPAKEAVLLIELKEVDGRSTRFNHYLSQQLHANLSNRLKMIVIDRKNMDAAGEIDDRMAIDIGKRAGAQVVVYGTAADLEEALGVNIKIADVQKGTLAGGVTREIQKTAKLSAAIHKANRVEENKRVESAVEARVKEIRMEAAIRERMRAESRRKNSRQTVLQRPVKPIPVDGPSEVWQELIDSVE